MMALTATANRNGCGGYCCAAALAFPGLLCRQLQPAQSDLRVSAKTGAYDQVLAIPFGPARESGIVYCQRARCGSLAAKLNADGIKRRLVPCGMEHDGRSRSQDAFLRDEVRVVCATIAFWHGHQKPNVRVVIH